MLSLRNSWSGGGQQHKALPWRPGEASPWRPDDGMMGEEDWKEVARAFNAGICGVIVVLCELRVFFCQVTDVEEFGPLLSEPEEIIVAL